MIPKKIHYCWFGKGKKSKLALKCIRSWRQYCPEYEVIEWNEENFDIDMNGYTRMCYAEKKYAYLSDYVRLWVVEKYGGRESITYNALKKINPNTILVADPAFGLKTAYAEIPSKFINKNMVGINLSPMVQKEEKISGIIMKNYEILIEHILKETDMAIALIPHVIWDDSDDRIPLMQLYERYKKSGRVLVIEDQNCSKLKYAISKCRFFVGARTHSTIAAYSSGIPTLVVGYSVKARGIARDLFGDEEQYSLSVQRLKETDELLKKFRWILENEELIKKQLNSKIPEVIKRALTAKEYVERLL